MEPKKTLTVLNRAVLVSSILMSFIDINMIIFIFVSIGIEIILLDTENEWSDKLRLMVCLQTIVALYLIFMLVVYLVNK